MSLLLSNAVQRLRRFDRAGKPVVQPYRQSESLAPSVSIATELERPQLMSAAASESSIQGPTVQESLALPVFADLESQCLLI